MSFIPVAEDKPVGPQFFFPVHSVGGRQYFGGAGGRRRIDAVGRSVRAVNGSAGAIEDGGFTLCNGKVEPFKKLPELRIHCIGVFYKILVQALDICGVGISDKRIVLHRRVVEQFILINWPTNIGQN